MRKQDVLIVASAVVCEACTLWVGRGNSSVLLIAMFVVWVSAPFVATLAASLRLEVPLWALSFVAVISPIVYILASAGALPAPPAAPFLIVPGLSWALLVVAVVITRLRHKAAAPRN